MVAPLIILGLALIGGGIFTFGVGRTLKEGEPWYPGKDALEDLGNVPKEWGTAAAVIAVAVAAMFILGRRR